MEPALIRRVPTFFGSGILVRNYCFAIPAFSITAPHFAMSAFIRASISAGALALVSIPSSSARFLRSASANTARSAPLRVSTTAGGVPAGAYNAFHDTTSKPGTPLCATVGTLGNAGEGVGPVQASGRDLLRVSHGLSGS